MSSPHTPSPTGSVVGPLESGVINNPHHLDSKPIQEPIVKPEMAVAYITENEKNLVPTKEEVEVNEKNLEQNALYLGQLVFKLR